MEERLQKILSHAGVASRRKAEELILSGRVTVDGEAVQELGVKLNPVAHTIAVDGKPLSGAEEHRTFLFNKPRGCVSTVSDDRGRRTVLDFFRDIPLRLYPVGRLDADTEGLLLLTNDGALTQGLLHPRFEVDKTYLAKVTGDMTEAKLRYLADGVLLEDGRTAPARARILEKSPKGATVELTIHEGRNRQVRRMLAAVGCKVTQLERIRFGGLTLAGVARGSYRELTAQELASLWRIAGGQECRSL